MSTTLDPELAALAIDALCDLDHPVKAEARAWAAANLTHRDRVAADREAHFDHDGWQRLADHGVLGLFVPEADGGGGADVITALLTLEGLAVGALDQGLLYAAASQMCSAQVALASFGSEEHKQRWLPALCRGEAFGAFAITEPDHGSDIDHLEARAERLPGGGYRIDARKAHITLAPVADVVVLFASTDPSARGWGISAFVVPTDVPGVVRGPNRDKMGMRTTPYGDLTLDGVEVPESARLGPEGAGVSIFLSAMQVERAFVYVTQIGAMERQLEGCVARARERRVGGVPIGELQAVSHRIADMKLRHETARTLLYKAALHSLRRDSGAMAAALTKIATSEGAVASAVAAAQVHGANGYASELEHEREIRDAVGGLFYSGTSDVQRNIVARLLGVSRGSTR
ncbi:MAG: acyl-CoA dehydrogenase family protein [Acidimicrobiales bacterium]|jgi:hypothetical protein|nr:acyl-CoA dehydrogenase family protein [Acidimicrobiales bacterium]